MNISKRVVELLKDMGKTVSTMESCTGGALISEITNNDGSSSVTSGGFVTYSNDQKFRLGVPDFVIEEFTVYSEPCAFHMAHAAAEGAYADFGIGVTGLLSNEDPENPGAGIENVAYYAIVGEGISHVVTLNIPSYDDELGILSDRQMKKTYLCNSILKTFESLLVEQKQKA